MPQGKSLFHKFPDYRVDLEPNPERVRIRYGDHVIADSTETLLVRESRHDPVIYFPRAAVDFDFLERTEHQTFCPFKGDASYWSLCAPGHRDENAVWSYEDPFEEVVGLRGYLAFYEDRVEFC